MVLFDVIKIYCGQWQSYSIFKTIYFRLANPTVATLILFAIYLAYYIYYTYITTIIEQYIQLYKNLCKRYRKPKTKTENIQLLQIQNKALLEELEEIKVQKRIIENRPSPILVQCQKQNAEPENYQYDTQSNSQSVGSYNENSIHNKRIENSCLICLREVMDKSLFGQKIEKNHIFCFFRHFFTNQDHKTVTTKIRPKS